MKLNKMALALSLVCFSSAAMAYDDTPINDNDYYDNNSYGDYNDDRNYEERNYEQPKYKQARNRGSNSRQYSSAGKAFVFDPKTLEWYAYQDGNLINSGRASGGRHYCADIRRGCKTPVGVFRVGSKGGPGCKSSKYPVGKGNAPMPYCMFFHGGYAIHGSWSVPEYNASHGCIRVQPQAARWLSQNFIQPGTRVIVKSYR